MKTTVASLQQIHDSVLAANRYFLPDEPEEIDLAALVKELKELESERQKADAQLWKVLAELGYT